MPTVLEMGTKVLVYCSIIAGSRINGKTKVCSRTIPIPVYIIPIVVIDVFKC